MLGFREHDTRPRWIIYRYVHLMFAFTPSLVFAIATTSSSSTLYTMDSQFGGLLHDSGNRFVLFPIRYPAVCRSYIREVTTLTLHSFGRCTRILESLSGRRRSLTYPKTLPTGRRTSTTTNDSFYQRSYFSLLLPMVSLAKTLLLSFPRRFKHLRPNVFTAFK